MRGSSQPVAGFASKTEAIRAMHAQGMTPFMIADKIGSTPGSVSERIRQLKKAEAGEVKPKPPKAAKPKPEKVKPVKEATRDTRGIWTPEKLKKAHRLFGKIMIYLAEALQVPADELLEYGLKGVMPPMGEKQRVAQLVDREQQQPEQPATPSPEPEPPVPLAMLPPPTWEPSIDADHLIEPEPSRDDDEAELAALDAEDAENDDDVSGHGLGAGNAADGGEAPAAAPGVEAGGQPEGESRNPIPPPAARHEPQLGHEYYLTDEAGQWLHESLEALTKNKRFAWKGTTKKIEVVFKRMPKWKVLVPERVG